MEFNQFGLTPIVFFNFLIWVFFTFAYLYQAVFMFAPSSRARSACPRPSATTATPS